MYFTRSFAQRGCSPVGVWYESKKGLIMIEDRMDVTQEVTLIPGTRMDHKQTINMPGCFSHSSEADGSPSGSASRNVAS